jgi:DNA-binding MarR family transcriptional regulator
MLATRISSITLGMRVNDGVLEPTPRLTARQVDVLRFIWGFFRQWEIYPTHREIADGIGAQSTNVAPWLNALVRKGVLVKKQGTARNIRLTTAGVRALERAGAIGSDEQLEL